MRRLTLAALLAACQHAPPVDPASEVPAVIVQPTEASRAALAQAVSVALGGVKVTLADFALTQSSELTIERVPRRDPEGRLLDGRGYGEKPIRFKLLKSGADCVLIHEETGRRYKLADTECAPEMQ